MDERGDIYVVNLSNVEALNTCVGIIYLPIKINSLISHKNNYYLNFFGNRSKW